LRWRFGQVYLALIPHRYFVNMAPQRANRKVPKKSEECRRASDTQLHQWKFNTCDKPNAQILMGIDKCQTPTT
jgi:hypothetical protein